MNEVDIDGIKDLELVASGASALVYRAVDADGENVAVKVFRGARGTEIQRRFRREVQAYERLKDHPEIADLLGSGLTAAGEPYLVMPYYKHGSLQDELDRYGPFELDQAVTDVVEACRALEFAHSSGVLHRDIKPGNLLRCDDGTIVIADFGIARVTNSGITSATLAASTPLYASPEVLADSEASVASEVYSLGALLYALLAGKPCFSGDSNIWATIAKIRSDIPPAIEGIPSTVMDLIRMAMSKEAHLRPQSAQQFAEFLEDAAAVDSTWTAPDIPTTPKGAASEATPTAPELSKPVGRADFSHLQVDTPEPKNRPLSHTAELRASSHRLRERRSWISMGAVLLAVAILCGFTWLIYRSVTSQVVTTAESKQPVDTSLPSPNISHKPDTVTTGDTDTKPDSTGTDTTGTDTSGTDSTGTDTTGTDSTGTGTTSPSSDTGTTSPSSGSGITNNTVDDSPKVHETDTPYIPPLNVDNFRSIDSYYFDAVLPSGWAVSQRDRNMGYGFRTELRNQIGYINIDTTPAIARDPNTNVKASAQEIAASVKNSTPVRTRRVHSRDFYWFTFENNQGVPSIDIFFEHEGAGYAIVAGSETRPDEAEAAAWLIAQTLATK